MVSQTHHAALPVLLCAPSLTLQVVPGASLSSGFYLALASERRRRETFERDESFSAMSLPHPPSCSRWPWLFRRSPVLGLQLRRRSAGLLPTSASPWGSQYPCFRPRLCMQSSPFFFFKVKPLLMCSLCPAKTLIHSGSHAGHPRSTSPTKVANVNERTPRKT